MELVAVLGAAAALIVLVVVSWQHAWVQSGESPLCQDATSTQSAPVTCGAGHPEPEPTTAEPRLVRDRLYLGR